MKTKKYVQSALVAITLLIAGAAVTAQAAQSEGDSTLQLNGSFYHAQGAEVGTLNLSVGYGYFATKNWEVGVLQSLGYSFIDNREDIWTGSTIPYVNYHILGLSLNDTFQPFVGAFVGASYNKDDETGTMGPQVGFKSFINDSTFVMVKYRYEWFFDELTFNDVKETRSDGNHVATLGVGFVF